MRAKLSLAARRPRKVLLRANHSPVLRITRIHLPSSIIRITRTIRPIALLHRRLLLPKLRPQKPILPHPLARQYRYIHILVIQKRGVILRHGRHEGHHWWWSFYRELFTEALLLVLDVLFPL